MASLPPGLVWLASYPKSGNTWMRVLLANLLANGDRPQNINALPEEEHLISRWRFADETLIEPDLLSQKEMASLRRAQADYVAATVTKAFVCKTHERFGEEVLGRSARCAIYLVRDPRDTAISMSHHMGVSLDETITRMTDPAAHTGTHLQIRTRIGDWAGHVGAWTDQDVLPVLTVRYEDLRTDTAASLSRVVAFLGGEATEAQIQRAVGYSGLEELQRQEEARGFRERLAHQKRFFRSGLVGEWRDVLTESQLSVLEQHGLKVMKRWGYSRALDDQG